MLNPHSLDTMFNVGGLPEGISRLRSLRQLRLVNCMTASLARAISLLTQLTRLEVFVQVLDGAHLDRDDNPFELMVRWCFVQNRVCRHPVVHACRRIAQAATVSCLSTGSGCVSSGCSVWP